MTTGGGFNESLFMQKNAQKKAPKKRIKRKIIESVPSQDIQLMYNRKINFYALMLLSSFAFMCCTTILFFIWNGNIQLYWTGGGSLVF